MHGQRCEASPGAELVQLELEWLARISGPIKFHMSGYHPPPGHPPPDRMAPGRDDGLTEHLATLDDGSLVVGERDADVATFALRPHIQDVDQVRGVAPGRKLLGGDVARRVTVSGVSGVSGVEQLHPHPVVVEGGQVRQL